MCDFVYIKNNLNLLQYANPVPEFTGVSKIPVKIFALTLTSFLGISLLKIRLALLLLKFTYNIIR